MKAYAGIDLYSSTNYTAVIDDQDQMLYGRDYPTQWMPNRGSRP